MLPLFLFIVGLAGSRAAPINPVFGRDLMTTTTFSTSSPFAAGPTSMSSITSSTYPNIPEPSPTGLPPGPSIKTVTQTSTAQSPDSSSQSLSAGAEEPGRGLAVGPPGAFSDSAVSPPSNNMTVGMDGTGTNGTNGTVHHMTRLWNCTIIPSPSNSTGSGVDGTANCTLLDIANLADTNGTHANSTQLALESLISGNKTSSPSSPLPSTSSSNSNSTATVGVPEEDEVEEEWEIVYECDEYEPSPNTTTTPSPSPSASSSSAPSLKQAEVAAFSSHETSPAPVPAGQGSNGTIPLTPSPVNPENSGVPAASSQPSGGEMDKMMNLSAGGSAMGGGMPSRPLFIRERLRSVRTRTDARREGGQGR